MARKSTRQRAYSKRSRTGCQTCRTRHVRCDEAFPACKNCTSTGRKCDGYERSHLPTTVIRRKQFLSSHHSTSTLRSLQQNILTNLPGVSSDELRSFTFYIGKTMPMMSMAFDSKLWQQLVLQMIEGEPAVFHAVVALSALHEHSFHTQNIKQNAYHHFSLSQYNRAISSLHQRAGSNDPQLRQVVLTCCIIFCTLELFQGDYQVAFAHLRQGLKILLEQPRDQGQGPGSAYHVSRLEPELVEVFTHLDLEATNFDLSGPKVRMGATNRPLTVASQDSGLFVTSILEARQNLASVTCELFCFWDYGQSISQGRVVPDRLALSAMRARVWNRVTEFTANFYKFIGQNHARTISMTAAQTASRTRSIDVIQIHLLQLKILLKASSSQQMAEMVFDECLPVFEKITDLSEGIITSLRNEYPDGPLPNLIMDIGIIPPLNLVCVKCRHSRVRERALHILESWPHREGPYDSTVVAHIVRTVMEIENDLAAAQGGSDNGAAPAAPAFIPENCRVNCVAVEISTEQREGVVDYGLSGGSEIRQRRFPL
ncbi:hypothetical protein BDV12DRAFT_210223 [Aspergillus spectabilis]